MSLTFLSFQLIAVSLLLCRNKELQQTLAFQQNLLYIHILCVGWVLEKVIVGTKCRVHFDAVLIKSLTPVTLFFFSLSSTEIPLFLKDIRNIILSGPIYC